MDAPRPSHHAPFREVTATWLPLTDHQRDAHARRSLGVPVARAGIDWPTRDNVGHYPRPVAHAKARVAYTRLGATGPPLVALGRPLLERDPAAWGAVCLVLADRRSLDEVTDRHRLTHAAVRQRVVRARPRLQSQLAGYHRRAG